MLPPLHNLISRRALQKNSFASSVVALVGRTSQWPDWYRWNTNAAHATTPDAAMAQPQDPDLAVRTCLALTEEYMRNLRVAEPNAQLVWLGFLLHLVQDLAVHQGRTNAEHAYNNLFLHSPDYHPRSSRVGLRLSAELVATLFRSVDTETRNRWTTDEDLHLLSAPEKTRVLGKRDFTINSIRTFGIQGIRYLHQPRNERKIRWNVDHVFRDMLRIVAK